MKKISFTVPLDPVGQKRPRFSKKGFAYKDKLQQTRESLMHVYISEAAPKKPFSGPILLKFIAYTKRPKSHFKAGNSSGQLKPNAPFWCTKKPDLDNIEKMLCDCCNGIIFDDDKQVCMSTTEKRYAMPGEMPRWEVEISEMGEKL